jgi:CAAX prenyl protease-like protein
VAFAPSEVETKRPPVGGSDWKPYVLPFAVLIVLLGLGPYLGIGPALAHPSRTLAVLATLLVFSRGVISFRPARPVSSILLGLAVFAIWIAPDLLFPGYRHSWLFDNALTRVSANGLPAPALRTSAWYVCFRVGGAALLIPVVEELFWRAWLMRWLISPDFEKIPLGAYAPQAFWFTAVLFASEHGTFWDVGLAAGILYNWWMIRTRSLADCILAHAVTNASLAAYVLLGGQWQYWN